MSKVHPNDLDFSGETANQWTNNQAQPPPDYGVDAQNFVQNDYAPAYGNNGSNAPNGNYPYGPYAPYANNAPPPPRRASTNAQGSAPNAQWAAPNATPNRTRNPPADDEPELRRGRNGHAYDHFWTDNFGPEGPSSTEAYMAGCGLSCCLGPCCSDVRQKDWKRVFLTFTFWAAVVELIMLIIEIVFNKNSTFSSVVLGLNDETLITLGAKYLPYIYCKGHAFRYVTSIVMHAGLLHYAFNTLFSYRVMLPREVYWGIIRTIVMYLASGIGGTILSLVIYQNSPSVGASGALCGIFGGYCVDVGRMWTRMDTRLKYSHGMNITMYVVIMVVMGFATEGIDNGAHLGGMLTGIFLGMIILQKKLVVRIIGGICMGLLWILPTALLYPFYKPDCSLYK